ncbi:nuclear transport factor 2A [Zea mays]|jgi:hypothetical protein|uniref:Nuclear transport factor 2A n=1 Tax=Zea mays TaxID=4577 RepID=A0A1D6KJX6_MAIZE|nr:nuclear transport factor 2A [Zea mays]
MQEIYIGKMQRFYPTGIKFAFDSSWRSLAARHFAGVVGWWRFKCKISVRLCGFKFHSMAESLVLAIIFAVLQFC